MKTYPVELNALEEIGEKAMLLLGRIVEGGSCGGPGDCHVPGWIHDMAVGVLSEHESYLGRQADKENREG